MSIYYQADRGIYHLLHSLIVSQIHNASCALQYNLHRVYISCKVQFFNIPFTNHRMIAVGSVNIAIKDLHQKYL